jgi:hypothetical protein
MNDEEMEDVVIEFFLNFQSRLVECGLCCRYGRFVIFDKLFKYVNEVDVLGGAESMRQQWIVRLVVVVEPINFWIQRWIVECCQICFMPFVWRKTT